MQLLHPGFNFVVLGPGIQWRGPPSWWIDLAQRWTTPRDWIFDLQFGHIWNIYWAVFLGMMWILIVNRLSLASFVAFCRFPGHGTDHPHRPVRAAAWCSALLQPGRLMITTGVYYCKSIYSYKKQICIQCIHYCIYIYIILFYIWLICIYLYKYIYIFIYLFIYLFILYVFMYLLIILHIITIHIYIYIHLYYYYCYYYYFTCKYHYNLIYIYIHTYFITGKPCVSPSLKLSFVPSEICFSCRRNALFFFSCSSWKMCILSFPMNLNTSIFRGGCSVFRRCTFCSLWWGGGFGWVGGWWRCGGIITFFRCRGMMLRFWFSSLVDNTSMMPGSWLLLQLLRRQWCYALDFFSTC